VAAHLDHPDGDLAARDDRLLAASARMLGTKRRRRERREEVGLVADARGDLHHDRSRSLAGSSSIVRGSMRRRTLASPRCPSFPSSTATPSSPPSRPAAAIEATRDAFVRHRRGEWVMPSKVYLESPPHGDFRAMPARGGDFADAQVISSVSRQPGARAADVIGLLVVSDATTSSRWRSWTPARDRAATGAVAAVAADAAAGRATAGSSAAASRRWAARCLPRRLRPGVCSDPRDGRARRSRRARLAAGTRGGRSPDVVSCVTPGPSRWSRSATCAPGCI
jgi:hypothetical protein